MKKVLVLALSFMLAAPVALAGYDLSLQNIERLTATDADDVLSTDYIQIFQFASDASSIIPAYRIWGLGPKTVSIGAGATIDPTTHEGRTLCFGSVAGTATLPAATGTGNVYKFTACAVPPGAGYVVTVTGDDTIDGSVMSTQDGGDTVVGWETAANTDTITFTSSTKFASGIGAWVELQDVGADQWTIKGQGTSTGTEATPFSGS